MGVAERFMRFIKEGSTVELTFDAFPDLTIESRVTFVAKSVDPANRTFNVETSFQNPGQLAPEMIADIQLLKQKHEKSISVPIDAVIDSETGRYVYLADGEVAKKVNVTIEAIEGETVLVEGLQPDDRLIVAGQRSISDGDTLNIVE